MTNENQSKFGKANKVQELIKKYNIDLDALEQEQKKLAKTLEIKDSMDFSDLQLVAGVDSVFLGNKIVSVIVVCSVSNDLEVIEKTYFTESCQQ